MQGYGAYRRTQGAVATQNGRDLEYRLLAQVTGALIKARDGMATLQERLNAILRNEKVWGVFQGCSVLFV
jgi:flagellar biosynthesis activator protein FlaF